MTDKKMEEEVPKVLKSVGYPITISKSYMSTVGAQHTWPTILAALSWLKTLIQVVILGKYLPVSRHDRVHR